MRISGTEPSSVIHLLKTSCKVALWSKLLTYFDDVTAMENNRQVRVNIDSTLIAIFHISSLIFIFSFFKCHA